ncbi:unnamed protein product [Rhizoctonia solani]|uniref:Uncharacterized protein n=1 Tax=Rhizoctonia solani TaxID=456999 RepID=A0A8H3HWN5_9AGAM|nr:unnamed protein product [Rhizoctonia solani]
MFNIQHLLGLPSLLTITSVSLPSSLTLDMSLFSITRAPTPSDLSRRFIAYILSPHLWQIPSCGDVSKQLSTAIDGYCKGLAMFVESAATVLGLGNARRRAIPGAYPMNGVHDLGTYEQQVRSSGNRFDTSEYNDLESGGEVLGAGWKFGAEDSGAACHTQPELLSEGVSYLDPFCSYSLPSEIVATPVEKEESHTISSKDLESAPHASVASVDAEVVPVTRRAASAPTNNSEASAQPERIRKYAGMRTLKLPGRQPRPMKGPNECELALRQIDEELAIEASQRDKYCARELAGSGIFMHAPTTKAQSAITTSPQTLRRIRRETSVGPLNTMWGARHTRVTPEIKLSKPGDIQTQTCVDGSVLSADQISSAVTGTPRQGRARSNAVYLPSKKPASVGPVSEVIDSKKPVATPASIMNDASEDPAVRRNKNRTSMSDWLSTISTGSNSLVADHVAIKSRPVLRASLILSLFPTPPLSPTGSTSSSDSSSPSTPITELFLPSPVVISVSIVLLSFDSSRKLKNPKKKFNVILSLFSHSLSHSLSFVSPPSAFLVLDFYPFSFDSSSFRFIATFGFDHGHIYMQYFLLLNASDFTPQPTSGVRVNHVPPWHTRREFGAQLLSSFGSHPPLLSPPTTAPPPSLPIPDPRSAEEPAQWNQYLVKLSEQVTPSVYAHAAPPPAPQQYLDPTTLAQFGLAGMPGLLGLGLGLGGLPSLAQALAVQFQIAAGLYPGLSLASLAAAAHPTPTSDAKQPASPPHRPTGSSSQRSVSARPRNPTLDSMLSGPRARPFHLPSFPD